MTMTRMARVTSLMMMMMTTTTTTTTTKKKKKKKKKKEKNSRVQDKMLAQEKKNILWKQEC